VGSLALMPSWAWQLGRSAIIDIPTFVIALISTVILPSLSHQFGMAHRSRRHHRWMR